jgi:hypothetical protein
MPLEQFTEPMEGFPVCKICGTHVDSMSVLAGLDVCSVCRYSGKGDHDAGTKGV